jgi:hypothetical protein
MAERKARYRNFVSAYTYCGRPRSYFVRSGQEQTALTATTTQTYKGYFIDGTALLFIRLARTGTWAGAFWK